MRCSLPGRVRRRGAICNTRRRDGAPRQDRKRKRRASSQSPKLVRKAGTRRTGPMIGVMPVKAGPLGPLIDNTTVTLYGSIDVSGDVFNPSVFDQGTKLGIASNISSFGIRVRHNLAPRSEEHT